MLGYLVATVVLASFVGLSIWQWRERDREQPITLWKQRYAGPEAIVAELGEALGLSFERRAGDLRWLGKVFLTPIWLFWGALRAQRPEQQLLRWRLIGTRGARTVVLGLDPDFVTVSVSCKASGFWVEPGPPLEQQEGLRIFHPIGSERFGVGTRVIERVFALGVASLRTDGGVLVARVPIEALSPATRVRLVDSLEELARTIEGEVLPAQAC